MTARASGSARTGWRCGSRPTPRPARRDLVEPLGAHAAGDGRPVIHDLGCGTGSMGRWLAPRLPGPQHWVLYDRDADLLAPPSAIARRGRRRRGGHRRDAAARHRRGCSPATWPARRLVTASALLDMLTADELERCVAACAGAGCPVLLTLSVVGRVELDAGRPAGRAHRCRLQRPPAPRDGGRPAARARTRSTAAAEAFGRLGAEVARPAEPVAARRRAGALAAEWLTGWVGAACEQDPGWPPRPADYARRRMPRPRRPARASPSTTTTCWRCPR